MAKGSRGIFFREGTWWISWCCPYGHRHREKIGPKTLARDEYQRRKVKARIEGFCPRLARPSPPMLFEDMAEKYLAWARVNKRPYRSTKTALSRLIQTFKGKGLGEIRPQDVEGYKARRKIEVKPSTVNRELALMRHLYNMAIRWAYAERNPLQGVKLFRESNERIRYLTPDEEARLFAVLPDKYKPVVTTALQTGLRMGELRSLRWRDISFETSTPTIARSKDGEVQRIPMNSVTRETLKRLPRISPLVFPDLPRHLSERFTELAKKAGLQDLHFHDLRHTYATRLRQAGVDIYKVKELMRHKDIRMTLRYAHIGDGELLEAVERLCPPEQISQAGEFVKEASGTPSGTDFFECLTMRNYWNSRNGGFDSHTPPPEFYGFKGKGPWSRKEKQRRS